MRKPIILLFLVLLTAAGARADPSCREGRVIARFKRETLSREMDRLTQKGTVAGSADARREETKRILAQRSGLKPSELTLTPQRGTASTMTATVTLR